MDSSQPKSTIDSLQLSNMQSVSALKILIVDDAESDRATYLRYLQSDSATTYRIIEVETLEEGLEMWRSQQPDIVLLDLNLADGDGLEFLETINIDNARDRVPVIMLTGQGNEKMAVNAMKLGAADYLIKGDITAKSLSTTVKQVLRETVLGQQLQRSQQQQILISEISLRIREFLNLEDILNAIVKEVRQFIKADRAIIYQFNPDMSGTIVAEDIVSPWQPCLNVQVEDTCFRENLGGKYCEGRIFAANDIYAANLTDCHIKLLERFQVRANLVVPILLPNSEQRVLWGLLILHQCSAPRIWQELDIQLLQQLSVQLAIGIKQAELYQNLESLNFSLERKVKERTQELQLQAQMLEQINDAVISIDLDGTILTWNSGAERLYEYQSHEVIGQNVSMLYLNEDLLLIETEVFTPLREKDSHEVELRNLTKSGKIIDIDLRLSVVRDGIGNPIRLIGCSNNISDRKQAEQALQQLNQSLETKVTERTQEIQLQAQMLEQIHDAVISTAQDGTILTWNIGAEGLYEYKSNEAIGQNITMLYLAEDLPLLQSLVFMPLLEKGTHEVEVRIQTKSGSKVYVSLRLSVVWDAMGNPIRLIGCSNNISDRKQAENALRESQALLQTVLDAFPLSVFWKDRQSVLLGCNQLFAITCGMKSSLEAIGKNVFEFSYTSDEALGYLADDQQVMESGLAKLNIEELITLASGEQQWLQTNKVPLRDSEGDVIGVMGTFQDISDRKFAEEALAESEAFNRQLIKEFPIGLASCRMDGQLVFVNSVFAKMLGRTIEEILELTYWDITPIKYAEQEAAQLERIQIEGRYGSYEKEYIHKDGHLVPVLLNGLAITQKGELIIWSSVQDISDRKQAELELQKTTERLALALKSGAVGCWEWNVQQDIAFWDERMYELFGVCKEKDLRIVYEIWAGALHPEDRAENEMMIQQIAAGQVEEYDSEYRVVHPDGSIHFNKAYGTLSRDASGNPLSITGINFDISDRKQSETRLQLANEELMRATRLKDEFLANMSHELRTPLNSILGMNEVLQEEVFGSINERQLKALQTIESSSRHLLALINDILDVAKIESGEVMLELTATDIDSLCQSSLAFIKQQALTKRIQLIPRIPKHLPEIMLDERRIRQVLINLLNNAVKFTLEGGTITLEVSQVQLESSTTNLTPLNYLKIAVIDTGIGISAENIQKLFQPFIQIDGALNRKYDGTGLGLALVKRFVELHGGTVELTSELGVGSCFAINLPINIDSSAIEEQTEQDLSRQSQIGQSQTEELISPLILLAEDNEANIATFSSYLDAKGYRILFATDGQQAIDLAKSHSPDLILMDIQMPVMDGLKAIAQIRLDPNLVDIPIVALTALAMEGDRERCLAAGANEYLTKPVKLKQLATSIQQFLMQRKNNV